MDQDIEKPLTLSENDGNKIMISLLKMFYKESLSNNLCYSDNKDQHSLNIKKKDFNVNFIANKDQANKKQILEMSMNYDLQNPNDYFKQLLCLTESTVEHVFETCPEKTLNNLF